MDVGAALVAHGEAPETLQPCDGALDYPPTDTEAAAMWGASAGEDRNDAARPQPVPVRLGVIAAVTLERIGFPAGSSAPPAHGRQRLDYRVEVRDVVDVGGRYLRDERDAARIGFFPRARRGLSRCR